MKRHESVLWLLLLTPVIQCSSPQTENKSIETRDTIKSSAPEISAQEVVDADDQLSGESGSVSIDLDEFAKNPFQSDYPYIKSLLLKEGLAFTIIAEDTIHSEHRIIEFDSARIDFLDSDPRFQDELGDLICSSDISSRKFIFNQDVMIGMPQEDFLSRANLTQSSLKTDTESGLSYYSHTVSWHEEGYWKVTFWVDGSLLVRIQSEINPCYYDYGD